MNSYLVTVTERHPSLADAVTYIRAASLESIRDKVIQLLKSTAAVAYATAVISALDDAGWTSGTEFEIKNTDETHDTWRVSTT